MILFPLKENAPTSPSEPAGRPLYSVPSASAASSRTGTSWRRQTSRIGSMSAGWPYRWTGMTAFGLRERAREERGIEHPGLRIAVDEHRPRAQVDDRVHARDERERRDDHLVAG